MITLLEEIKMHSLLFVCTNKLSQGVEYLTKTKGVILVAFNYSTQTSVMFHERKQVISISEHNS